jgi:hypothetical protein
MVFFIRFVHSLSFCRFWRILPPGQVVIVIIVIIKQCWSSPLVERTAKRILVGLYRASFLYSICEFIYHIRKDICKVPMPRIACAQRLPVRVVEPSSVILFNRIVAFGKASRNDVMAEWPSACATDHRSLSLKQWNRQNSVLFNMTLVARIFFTSFAAAVPALRRQMSFFNYVIFQFSAVLFTPQ